MTASAVNQKLFDRVNNSFVRQGMMQHLGARIVRVLSGEVEFALPMSDRVTQQQGAFHGGALGALADICCGYAALTTAPEGMEVTTVEYKINFVSAAMGQEVVRIGKVHKAGRTLTITSAELFDVQHGVRKLCGLMQATLITVAQKY
jgi:uncharacterized protein (TIGR00369 family)